MSIKSSADSFDVFAERERLAKEGMYRPEFETDACGVGLVAATDGKASRRVVTAAIDALKAVWHRGAVDADGKTGDGAGIHVDLPASFSMMPLPMPDMLRFRTVWQSVWSSCREPTFRHKRRVARLLNLKSLISVIGSMDGDRFRSISRLSAKRRCGRARKSNRS